MIMAAEVVMEMRVVSQSVVERTFIFLSSKLRSCLQEPKCNATPYTTKINDRLSSSGLASIYQPRLPDEDYPLVFLRDKQFGD